MNKRQSFPVRLLSALLALMMLFSLVVSSFALETETLNNLDLPAQIPAPLQLSDIELAQIYEDLGLNISLFATQGSIPDIMWNNDVLDSLSYLGYNVAQQKEDGKLYDVFYTTQYDYANNAYGSGIPYDSAGASTGYETVTDTSTATGKAPNVSKWQSKGLCCASFATYYLLNYLPNIKGTNAELAGALHTALTTNGKYHNLQSPYAWYYGLEKMIKDGTSIGGEKVEKFTATQRADALKKLQPGDVIIFTQTDSNNNTVFKHVAIYIGDNNGKQWIANVSNAKGPGLDLLTVYENYYDGKGGEPIYYHLPLAKAEGYIEINKTDEIGNPLAGAYFKAVNKGTSQTYYFDPTNANGYTVLSELPFGTYTVTETTFPSGYTSSGTTEWTVTLSAASPNATETINATNKLITGAIGVRKTDDAGGRLSGVVFTVYSDQYCTLGVGTITTNDFGIGTLGGLVPGTYYVKETSALPGHLYNDTVYPVTVVADSTTYANGGNSIINTRMGSIQITKTGPSGNLLGAGYVFKIYSDAACQNEVSTITTASSSVASSGYLAPGTYYVRETGLPASDNTHNMNTTTFPVLVGPGETSRLTVANAYKYGTGEIIKTSTNGGTVQGWEFAIYDSSNTLVANDRTDANGKITLTLLPGTYKVKEVGAAKQYWTMDSATKTLTITAGNRSTVSFQNRWLGELAITKTATNGGTVQGWEFEIYDFAGTLVATKITDANGKILLTGLNPGTYKVKEIGDPKQYWNMDTEVKSVAVTAGQTATVSFQNKWLGELSITKTATNGGTVEGWEFEIYDPHGALIATKITDANGKILLTGLAPGSYKVKEVGGPKQYWDMDTETKSIAVSAGQTATVTFQNKWLGELSITKTATNGGTVEGWEFEIYGPDGNLFATKKTDADGKILLTNLEPGEYKVKEAAADRPYWVMDDEEKSVTVSAGQTTQVGFENQWKGDISIEKRLTTDGSVGGWEFVIKDSEGNEVARLTSDEFGVTVSGLLEPGEYTVEENIPENSLFYCKTDNPVKLTVKAGETTNISFTNALRPGEIIVEKINFSGEHLAGAKFLLEWSEDGITWTPVVYSDKEDVIKGGCSSAALADGSLTTDENGLIVFTNLYPGLQYRVTELEAPEGYALLSDHAFVGELPVEDLAVKLLVHNGKAFILPATGTYGTALPVGFGAALAVVALLSLLGLGFFCSKRGFNNSDERI